MPEPEPILKQEPVVIQAPTHLQVQQAPPEQGRAPTPRRRLARALEREPAPESARVLILELAVREPLKMGFKER